MPSVTRPCQKVQRGGTAYQPQEFEYQQLDPAEYSSSIQYPPHTPQPQPIDYYSVEYPDLQGEEEEAGEDRSYPDLDPRYYDYQSVSVSDTTGEAASELGYGGRYAAGYQSSNYYDNDYYGGARPQTVEEALYVLGKNLFGQNVTDRLFPVAKQVAQGFGKVGEGLNTISNALPPFPAVEFDSSGVRIKTATSSDQQETTGVGSEYPYDGGDFYRDDRNAEGTTGGRVTSRDEARCTTPKGGPGRCTDLSSCPLLLADFSVLRKSVCFQSLFVPGVCCPDSG